jgi:hypothetical protein
MEFHRTKIIKCEPHDDYKLWLLFDDGVCGEVDLKKLVGKGVFSAWESEDFFKSVYVDKKNRHSGMGGGSRLRPLCFI